MSAKPTSNPDNSRARRINRGGGRRSAAQSQGPRKPTWVERKIGHWGARIMGAMSEGGMGAAEEAFESNQTSRDYLFNTIGLTAWGMVFPVLTVIITQLIDAEQAGMFSLAFVVGQLLMIVANYGVRTYQVSDRDEHHSFLVYQVNRWLTCIIMMVAGWLFCAARGYDATMGTIAMAVFTYKMVDGLADVYEGRLQQMDKLYLAGASQTVRSLAVLTIFSLFLLLTRNLVVASIAMAVAAAISFVLLTLPLSLLETPRSGPFSPRSLVELFVRCAPVFLALFLYMLIDNMPKFMMEGTLSYDNQLFFNALYFPAQTILMTVGFLYKPLLGRMADTWNDLSRRRRFDRLIIAMVLVVAAITVVGVLVMRWIGIPVISFLYGIDFEPLRRLSYLMLIAGGFAGGVDFLYQVITVMRRQAVVTRLYLITFVFALVVPYMLIRVSGLEGAVASYLIIMAILFVLMLLEYVGARLTSNTQQARSELRTAPARSAKAPTRRLAPRPSVRQDGATRPKDD